jgi:hypothetical protein
MIHSAHIQQLYILRLNGHSEMIHSPHIQQLYILRLNEHSEMIHSPHIQQLYILRLNGHSEMIHSPNLQKYFIRKLNINLRSRDSSVGIAIGYGLDGPGIESRWGRAISHTSRPVLGPTQSPVQ